MKRSMFALMFLLGSLSAFAQHDHWHNRQQVLRAANDLCDKANHFHDTVHSNTGYSHLDKDAHEFAEKVEHFEETAKSGTLSHARVDFQELRGALEHMRHTFFHAHRVHRNHHVALDWQELNQAFSHLSHMMMHAGGGHGRPVRPIIKSAEVASVM